MVGEGGVSMSPWTSGAVQNPSSLGIQSRLYLIERVRGDQLFRQAAVLSGIYKSNSSNLHLLFFEYHFTNNVDYTRHLQTIAGVRSSASLPPRYKGPSSYVE